MNALRILIVGSGPAGLISALALRRNGIPIRIIERRDSYHGGIRGTALQPRTEELLELLDVLDEVKAISTPPYTMGIHGAGREITSEVQWAESGDLIPSIPYPKLISVNQSVFEQVLRERLEKLGVTVELGVEFASIERNGDEGVTVRLRSGGSESTESFAYVVAADGARGPTRSMLGLNFLGETKEADFMFTANVECTDIDRTHWHRWGKFGEKVFFLKPVNPAPLFQIQAMGPQLPQPLPNTIEGIQEMFNDVSQSNDIALRNATWISVWRANIRMASKFTSGRVFLVGDAAHCHSPAGGQGSNTGMLDALNISWKLALVYKGLATPSLLDSYDTERIPVVAEMLNLTKDLHEHAWRQRKLTMPSSTLDVQGRNTEKDAMFRPKQGLQLGVNYRWSNIIREGRQLEVGAADGDVKNPYGVHAAGLRAGDRAPDAPFLVDVNEKGEGTKRLFDLMKGANRHTILAFTGTSGVIGKLARYPDVARVVVILPSNSTDNPLSLINDGEDTKVVVDSQGHAYTGYEVTEKGAYVVVRPDGFIGAYVMDADQVAAFFGLFLKPVSSLPGA